MPCAGVQRIRFRLDEDLGLRQAEHAHVGLHAPLAIEQGRVHALSRLEGLDVVGQLALEVLGGVRAIDVQPSTLAAGESCLLAERPVLPIKLNCEF